MGDNKISDKAVEAAVDAWRASEGAGARDLMRDAIEAALPHLQGEAVPVAGLPWASYWLSQGRPDVSHDHEAYDLAYEWAMQFHPQPAELSEQHPDDLAVDTFANAMKSKMTISRWRGRSGWDDRSQCSQSQLSAMLRAHVEKGDPVDVANFCMMLSLRGEGIESAAGLSEVSGGHGELPPLPAMQGFVSLYGMVHAYSAEQMQDYARAALAATGKQQVGEVQGAREQFEVWATKHGLSLITGRGDYHFTETRHAWSAWQAALASRQPVGQEPVAVEIPQGAIINGAAFADRLERDYQFECPAGPLVNCTDYVEFRRCFDFLAHWASSLPSLYAAPPAQGIDLGQFRLAVHDQYALAENDREAGRISEESLVWHASRRDRLLALIDGRDAGAGVG